MEHVSRATPSLECPHAKETFPKTGEKKKEPGTEVLSLLCNAAPVPLYWIDLGWAAGSLSASNANDFWLVVLQCDVFTVKYFNVSDII